MKTSKCCSQSRYKDEEYNSWKNGLRMTTSEMRMDERSIQIELELLREGDRDIEREIESERERNVLSLKYKTHI